MADFIYEQLEEAYALIKKGDKEAALAIIRPICQKQPDNENAWWLASHALSDPDQIRAALGRVLYINPFHEQAQARLDKFNQHAPPAKSGDQRRSTANLPQVKTPVATKTESSGLLMVAVLGIVLVMVLVIGVFIVLSNKDNSPTPAAQNQNTAQAPSNTRLPRTHTPLPPTWTPAASPTPYATRPTFTPVSYATRVLSTADPALFGDTYWEGNGDGRYMDRFMRSEGRYLRHFDFPVRLYVYGAEQDPIWEAAIQNAIEQISVVVPIERVATEGEATMVVFIMPREEYERWVGCDKEATIGCASIKDLGDLAGGDRFHRVYSEIYVSTDATYPIRVMLHEFLHAMGLKVHSTDPADILFSGSSPDDLLYELVDWEQTSLSQRDLNTLRRLYANPSYAD
jgi:predicted Zn-dependent protease